MPLNQYEAYRRWLDKWVPHILYGAAASGASAGAGEASVGGVIPGERVSALPGGEIVRAF